MFHILMMPKKSIYQLYYLFILIKIKTSIFIHLLHLHLSTNVIQPIFHQLYFSSIKTKSIIMPSQKDIHISIKINK